MPSTVRRLSSGTFVYEDDGRSVSFHCVRSGDVAFVHWDGRAYEVREAREGGRAAHKAATGSLEAPMPGKVIKLSASVGQEVRKGQEILVVEAMKMENQIRAPKDGRLTRLAAKVGDMVGPGVVLAEIE